MNTQQRRGLGVLIPGFNRSASDWTGVMMGNLGAGILGRIPTGLKAAIENKADLVYFGGGAEAQAMLAYARGYEATLVQYLGPEVKEILNRKSFVGTNGVKTVAEVSDALLVCNQRGLSELLIASDEGHLLRCLKYAIEQTRHLGLQHIKIGFAQSDTSCTREETLVFEGRTTYRPNLHEVAQLVMELDHLLNGNVDGIKDELLTMIGTHIKQRTSWTNESPRLRAVK